MKKTWTILVLGANGGSGLQFTQQALEAGHTVIALVRSPEKLALSHPNLKTVKGDVLRPETFIGEMEGVDAVVSALGVQNAKPVTVLYSEGITNVLRVMAEKGVDRFLCISAQAVVISPNISLLQKVFTRYILQPILKNPYADMVRMEEIIRQSSAAWTIMRPPMLTDKPVTGKYRVGINTYLRSPLRISRADLAHYMLNHLQDPATYRAVVEVAY